LPLLILGAFVALPRAWAQATPPTPPTIYLPIVAVPPPTPTASPTLEPTATSEPVVPTATSGPAPSPTSNAARCDPSYPTVCIPPPPPDLDCGDISYRRFRVIGSDPHNFDTDNDGVGCESG